MFRLFLSFFQTCLPKILVGFSFLISSFLISSFLIFSQTIDAHPMDEIQIALRRIDGGISFRISLAKHLIPANHSGRQFLEDEAQKLKIFNDGILCLPESKLKETVEDHSLELIAAEMNFKCEGSYAWIRISKDSNLSRRASITAIWGKNWTSEALELDASEIVIRMYEPPIRMLKFVNLGINHLLSGFDHLIFLLTLLAAAVYVRTNKKKALKTVFYEISLFTFAHCLSIVVAASVREPVPSRFVEISIGATILFSGLCFFNAGFFSVKKLIPLIVPFGLMHGLGFADSLRNLGLNLRQDWLEVLAFNFGIEISQLLIGIITIGLFYPFMKWLVSDRIRPYLAVCVAAIGLLMIVMRSV